MCHVVHKEELLRVILKFFLGLKVWGLKAQSMCAVAAQWGWTFERFMTSALLFVHIFEWSTVIQDSFVIAARQLEVNIPNAVCCFLTRRFFLCSTLQINSGNRYCFPTRYSFWCHLKILVHCDRLSNPLTADWTWSPLSFEYKVAISSNPNFLKSCIEAQHKKNVSSSCSNQSNRRSALNMNMKSYFSLVKCGVLLCLGCKFQT